MLAKHNADHFSIYGVGTVATATYKFYVGQDEVDTQILLNGEYLLEPEAPEKIDNQRFRGWKIEGGTFINFSQPIAVTETISRNVNAVYEDVVYVYFLYDDGVAPDGYDVIATKDVMPNTATDGMNVPLVVKIPGKAFSHWSQEPGGIEFNFSTPISTDTNLYAVLIDRWKVTFDAQGGSSVLPKYVNDDESIGDVAPTIRAGYTFNYWSQEPGGTQFDLANTQVNSDLKLFAVWQATNTSYTIIYWIENADDVDFSYESSRTLTGTTGSTITLANNNSGYSTNNISSAYRQYFTYQRYDTGKQIAGNGSTIINVYFTRNTYDLKFYSSSSGSSSSYLKYTITAKYGQYIANQFPIPGYPGRAWKSQDTTLYPFALQTLDRMPGKNVNFNLYNNNSTTLRTIKYYTEDLTGGGYTLLKTVQTYFIWITYEEEYHPIQGFDRQSYSDAGFYKPWGSSDYRKDFTNNNVDLYYLRNSYNLQFQR